MSSRSSNKEFPSRHFVGWVQSAHGIRGEIFVRLQADQAEWLDDLHSLFLLAPDANELREFEVQFARPHKDGLIVKFREVVDRNTSELLRKHSVYIDSQLLVAEMGEAIYLKQVLGFAVVDRDQRVGEIVGFSSNGVQDLLRVKTDNGEVLIPFVDDFIVDLNFETRTVNMSLPEGLLDLD